MNVQHKVVHTFRVLDKIPKKVTLISNFAVNLVREKQAFCEVHFKAVIIDTGTGMACCLATIYLVPGYDLFICISIYRYAQSI